MCQWPLAHDGCEGLAISIDGSRWREAGPYDGTPEDGRPVTWESKKRKWQTAKRYPSPKGRLGREQKQPVCWSYKPFCCRAFVIDQRIYSDSQCIAYLCACECIHLLWSGYPYMPADSHCSIVWPEPRPQRSEQLLQTQHTTHAHTHTHKTSGKRNQNKSKQMANMRCFNLLRWEFMCTVGLLLMRRAG